MGILLGDCLTCEELSGGYSTGEDRRSKEMRMSRFFIGFPIGWFRSTQNITSIGLFYKEVGFLQYCGDF